MTPDQFLFTFVDANFEVTTAALKAALARSVLKKYGNHLGRAALVLHIHRNTLARILSASPERVTGYEQVEISLPQTKRHAQKKEGVFRDHGLRSVDY